MQVGAMNNPHANINKEIEWIGKSGFDFIDLTIEPTRARPEDIDVKKAKALLRKYCLDVVGHMGDWRLPKDSHYESLRTVSAKEMVKAVRTHAKLGAKKVTIHAPGANDRIFDQSFERYSSLIATLLKEAKKLGVTIMIENGDINKSEWQMLMERLLRKFPRMALHIDVGHSNIGAKKNRIHHYMKKYGKRIRHFHFSDNKGKKDDHKELGWGRINWKEIITLIKRSGYDGTITLETFRSGPAGTIRSMKRLRKMWDAA
ncbi:sugar phosphate isomerase/epimerase [Candidatus Woesearchaeota archaeon]|nr:sugar phosphate isomerase/epimerase [Candidatus Woesearchaeota archaeon]